ncbi:SpoIIE family protein phosphatase [Streptomyces sp. HNM0574]|uniref:PP2C family protein-serine/threonine phosphatase n=1 Tax=Streptomyces sp. HNM0574 TaxID=2714954 RepID=UPI00146ADB07|nr:SpoIIE family protein phosphatase [Streptomyces sp. HNM0574]NLU70434.1 SpoIIE family protein phosphatase [Streptomyces sp. HNM0574]
MPSHLHADRSVPCPPDRGTLDALITQARRLRGDLDAVRPDDVADAYEEGAGGSRTRWQRALCDLAARHLDNLGGHLDQLREGVPAAPYAPLPGACAPGAEGGERAAYGPLADGLPPLSPAGTAPAGTSRAGRVGSADWDFLTDRVSWSEELYAIFGRTPEDGPLTLDELPSWVLPEDQPRLAAAVTDCLVDGRPVDQEFRIVRPDGTERGLHMIGEPLLDADGATASMWAVVRDVSALRSSESTVHETRDSVEREEHLARTEHRVAVELQETVLPPWRGSLRLSEASGDGGPATGALDVAAHYLPSTTSPLIGGDWYDALELPDGGTLLSAGDLTGHGVAATSGMAMLLGAVRGMAVAGIAPGTLMGHLNQMLDSAAQPALGSALCCRYEPRGRTLTWAQAGHPAPLVFRGGGGHALRPPEGVLLGVTSGSSYGECTERLEPGDILVLHTDGLAPRAGDEPQSGAAHLLRLAPRFSSARTAQECVRAIVEVFGDQPREDDACVLVARVSDD